MPLCCLPAISQFVVSFILLSIMDSLTEDTDLIPGMMLSNCRPETDLHNQTIGGKMGHVGKQLFWSLLAWFLNNMSTRTVFICFSLCKDELSVHRCCYLNYNCCLFLDISVMCTCFLRAALVLLFCYRCSGYRYKSIKHSSYSSINAFRCSLDTLSL